MSGHYRQILQFDPLSLGTPPTVKALLVVDDDDFIQISGLETGATPVGYVNAMNPFTFQGLTTDHSLEVKLFGGAIVTITGIVFVEPATGESFFIPDSSFDLETVMSISTYTSGSTSVVAQAYSDYGFVAALDGNVTPATNLDDVRYWDSTAGTVDGFNGNDVLFGLSGGNIFQPGYGADTIYGGDGVDTVSYTNIASGVTVNLRTNGTFGGDQYYDIENIWGTSSSDTLEGDDGVNYIFGADGVDFLTGNGGADTLEGGSGSDWALYTLSPTGVRIELYNFGVDGAGFLGHAEGDILVSIFNIIGSAYNDEFTGSTLNTNHFIGEAGDDLFHVNAAGDTIEGGIGEDTLSFASYTGVNGTVDLQSFIVTGYGGIGFSGIENLIGSVGDDKFYGDGLDNDFYGGGGADIIFGRGGNDFLFGDIGADYMYGGAGADRFHGGTGDDYLFVDHLDTLIQGGANYDRLIAEAGSLALNIDLATTGIENAQGSAWDDVFDATNVGEAVKLWGHSRDDTLTGSAFDDYINGGAGDDTLNGLGGADILDGSTGADIFDGGAGNDIMYVDADDTVINGGADYDQIHVRGYSTGVNINMTIGNLEYANGNTQNDTFNATGATWVVKLFGQGGNDTLTGGDNADQLYGSDGQDIISGNGANDIISGGTGADQLYGGAGDDVILVDADDTVINGGADYDRVYVTTGSAGVTINMATANVEFAYGDAGNDVFNGVGSTVAVKLQGRDGADTLTGGNIADEIYGGTGADNITGGTGNDFLSGGGVDGAVDTFFFTSGWGDDTLSDFQNGEDLLDVSALGTNFAGLTITALGANNSVVSFGGDSITLLGMQLADVDAGDFVFV